MTVFERPESLAINAARLDHLASLQLPLYGRTALEVGAGIGMHTGRLQELGLIVTALEGREENRTEFRKRHTTVEIVRADVQATHWLFVDELGTRRRHWDVVVCFGLLYHTKFPSAALLNLTAACREILVLETVVCDTSEPIVQFVRESDARDQALDGTGCRPSPAWVVNALAGGFAHVYVPKTQPRHRDFEWTERGSGAWERDGHLLRRVFVASRAPLVRLCDYWPGTPNPALVRVGGKA